MTPTFKHHEPESDSLAQERRTYLLVAGALFVLLGLTIGSSYMHFGPLNIVITLAIAGAKAGLIILYFMHVRHSVPLVRLTAFAGLLWLVVLIGLTIADYQSRGWH